MRRLFMIANRLPLQANIGSGNIEAVPHSDGYSSGLQRFYSSYDIKWIGRTGLNIDELSETDRIDIDNKFRQKDCIPIYLDAELKWKYLEGFCENTLWPVFNYFTEKARYEDENWEAYVEVNQRYADLISRYIKEDDIVWVHDYHLLLLPRMIREKFPYVSIGFFQHIPFPSFEVFRLLPWRDQLLEGILGADLIGYHIYDYQRHFLSCVRRLLGYETYFNRIKLDDRILKVDAFPMGIDFDSFHRRASELLTQGGEEVTPVQEEIQAFHSRGKGRKLILSVDRLDYTKGIPDRIRAYESFLNSYPEYREKISLFIFVIPSREDVTDYQELKKELDELVGRINGQYGVINWQPIWYFYRTTSRDEAIAMYSGADIALITPIRDGMNLNAKEYIACRTDQSGVLILSEMAGAAKEMGESIIVNPNNQTELAEALFQAINMPLEEQVERNTVLQKRLKKYNEERWAKDFINGLEGIKKLQETNYTHKVSIKVTNELIEAYQKASRRMIFLDYDGTLTGFHKDPQKAVPNEELYLILNDLLEDEKNTMVIISGRDKETLSKWFKNQGKLSFIAEHGVWNKDPGEEWKMTEKIDQEWMEIILPLLEYFVDRTPRSFVEKKNYSLVWHYRSADPDMGPQRSWELKEDLKIYVANLNLEIMDGDKVIEIKNAGINKGRAALNKIGDKPADFMLALGDDWTDEFTFGALPETAYTIKVGTKSTQARYYIDDVSAVRSLLTQLCSRDRS